MTKRLMKDALLDLLEKQELANISVTAICDTADVHRSTFYKYYTDTIDLLEDIERDFLVQIPSPPEVLNEKTEEQLLIGYISSLTDTSLPLKGTTKRTIILPVCISHTPQSA